MEKPSDCSYFSHIKKPTSVKSWGNRIVLPVSKAAKYGYSNARVSAMKSLLLKKQSLYELARVRSIEAVIEMLERTCYKENLVKFSMHHHGSELVQIAAALHFADVVNKLRTIIPESDRKVFDIMLTKWDITNAKAILHARKLGKKDEELAPFIIPIGLFNESEVKMLFASTGDFFLRFAKTFLGKRIIASKIISSTELEKLFMKFGHLEITKLECILDTFYYSLYTQSNEFKQKELAPIVKIFKKEIDLKNTLLFVRLKKHGITDKKIAVQYFIKGGTIPSAVFTQISEAKTVEQAIREAAKILELPNIPSNAEELETLLNIKFANLKLKAFYRSVLSLSTILGFLFLKEEEMHNLRKIAVGKEFGIPDDKINEMLVVSS